MALEMTITLTPRAVIEVPDDIASDLQEAYEALIPLPVDRVVNVDFANPAEARMFARQGRAWAAAQRPSLVFTRKGDTKGMPSRVSFRIHASRKGENGAEE